MISFDTTCRRRQREDEIKLKPYALADDAARRSFLAQQIAGWEFRYELFRLTEGCSEPVTDPTDPPTS